MLIITTDMYNTDRGLETPGKVRCCRGAGICNVNERLEPQGESLGGMKRRLWCEFLATPRRVRPAGRRVTPSSSRICLNRIFNAESEARLHEAGGICMLHLFLR